MDKYQLDQKLTTKERFFSERLMQGCDIRADDRISRLPEELVCSIISLLPLREAARTSILCKRWKYSWKNLFNLNIDYKNMYGKSFDLMNMEQNTRRQKWIFAMWVSKILMKDNTSEKIMSCKIAHPLNGTYGKIIDLWVKNLASKSVEELSINLSCADAKMKFPWNPYFFEYSLFPRNNSLKRLSLHGCWFRPPKLKEITGDIFSNLVSLTLGHAQLHNYNIAGILSSCLSLEHLSFTHCSCPSRIMVGAYPQLKKRLKLKHFEVISCDHPSGKNLILNIDGAVNLQSVGYIGGIYKTTLKNSAQPYKLKFGFDSSSPDLLFEEGLNYAFSELPLAFPQIETLSLSLANIKEYMVIKKLETFSKLMTLDLDMYKTASPKGLFEVTSSILKASPLLHRFVIHLPVDFLTSENSDGLVDGNMAVNLETDDITFWHERLSDVEIKKFTGVQIQVDYVILFLDNAINLEKMSINRQCMFHQGNWKCKEDETPLDLDVKQVYDLFSRKVPKNMQFQVL